MPYMETMNNTPSLISQDDTPPSVTIVMFVFRMQNVCQDLLEALEHFESMLEKVERDLGWSKSAHLRQIYIAQKQVNFLQTLKAYFPSSSGVSKDIFFCQLSK